MDLMSIRRGLMSQMGNSGLPKSVFEIVEVFRPEADVKSITFPYQGAGTYFIVSDPPMTYERAALSSYSWDVQAYAFMIRRNKVIFSLSVLALGSNNNDDYWGKTPTWVDTDKTILRQEAPSSAHFMAGYTYYLLFIRA